MTNPLYAIEQLPTTSQAAIREFNDRYIAAMGVAKPDAWADRLGALIPTNGPLVTFPVSQLRTNYQRTQGEGRAKSLEEKSFDVKTEEFDDGYEAKLYDLTKQVFAYRQWKAAPGRFLIAEARHRCKSIATLLEDGTNQDCVDGKKFFAPDHPANLHDPSAGTFSNYQNTSKDPTVLADLEGEVVAMMDVRDENGDKLDVRPDTILCPTEIAEPLKNFLKQNMIAVGGVSVTNPYMNGFEVVPVSEFTDANDWYLVDSKLIGELSPWVSLREQVAAALALRVFDEASDYFKKTGKLRIESHIWHGSSLGLPHAIRKIRG